MAWLPRLGAYVAYRPSVVLVRGGLLVPLVESITLSYSPAIHIQRAIHTLPSLAMALTAQPPTQPQCLRARAPQFGALHTASSSRALQHWCHWQPGRKAGPRVAVTAASAAAASSPQEPRQFSSQPWWKFWKEPDQDGSNGEANAELAQQAAAQAAEVSSSSAAAHKRELHAVNIAVATNGVILVGKAVAWWLTGSGAMLAEALHSIADIMNQVLLRMGVVQSQRAPTQEHPYGFLREKYIYALMSAVSIFCLGSGASLLHGFQALFEPPVLQDMSLSLIVLGASSLLEFYSLRVAARAIREGAAEQGYTLKGMGDYARYLLRGRDPTTAAVLAEDLGAVAGLGIASVATTLTWVTGNPVYDAIGSMGVGALMGGIAMLLIRNNKQFLIGRSMRSADHQRLVRHLQRDPMVLAVLDAKSEELGDGVYRFKAEIQWSGDRVVEKYLAGLGRSSVYAQLKSVMCRVQPGEEAVVEDAMDLAMMEFGKGVIRTVGEEIDRLETEMKELVPGLRFVDLETDKGKAGGRAWGMPEPEAGTQ